MDLADIAKKEEYILFDTSVNELGDFPWDIFPFNAYSQIDVNKIITAKNRMASFMDFINFDNTFTIKEVFEELSELEIILSNKGKVFNKTKRIILKKKIKTNDDNQEKEYNTLLNITHESILKVKKKIKKPEELIQYNILYNSILNVKKFSNKLNNYNIYTKKKSIQMKDKYLNTDEKLTAMLFYLSTVEYKSYVLVSRDYGIFLLADEFYRVICAEKNYKCLREMLIDNPIRIYAPSEYSDSYELIFSSKDEYSPYQLYKEIKRIEELKKKKVKLIKF